MERKDRAPLSPAAERKKKSRARQTGEKKKEVKAKDTTTRKEARRNRTAEEKDEDNHKRQTARGTRSSYAKEEEKKERRNNWAGRSPQTKEKHNEKRRAVREERTPEQRANENAEMKDRVQGLRQARRAVKSAQSGKFDATEVWEVPGRDFLFDRFQDDPQSSVLLWYANNGSWWEREPKMCIAWLRFYNELDRELKLEASAGAADADVTKQHEELCGLSVFKDEAGVVVRVACYC
jgi:hypothetical protein